MTSSPTIGLSASPPSFRSSSPFPQLIRSAAASSSSSLSSLFHVAPSPDEILPAYDDIRSHQTIISQAFSPTVAVISSRECDDLVRGKGCTGFLDLLRPYGDCVQGRVNVRDSQAMSIPVEDFSVKFVDFNSYTQTGINGVTWEKGPYAPKSTGSRTAFPGGDLSALERLLKTMVQTANASDGPEYAEYSHFLRKLLSSMPVSAHETFSHPVACILAVSSHNTEPIDALLGLYNTTNNAPIPKFIDVGFLRYYVLVHDNDHDEIEQFALIKRILT
jgi:trafficking protein particle complex subunit 8